MTRNTQLVPSITPVAYVEGRYIWNLIAVPVRVSHKRYSRLVATVANVGV